MLLDMLKYCRPEGSDEQTEFCERFLRPIMGKPDKFGNYILSVGDTPTIAFMAHHDTVHKEGGKQALVVDEESFVYALDNNCLGADCTTGVWLILEMIKHQVPGVYIVHSGEEIGCLGSSALVKSNPEWLKRISAAISFDRKGVGSIITHQTGMRTASDEFAKSLSAILKLNMEADPTGSYTDSNEYAGVVPECTNISVGYYNQHTSKERQDLLFAQKLRDALIAADWSKLVIARDPSDCSYDYDSHWFGGSSIGLSERPYDGTEERIITELVADYPEDIAKLLMDYGYTSNDLYEELGLVSNFLDDPDDYRAVVNT